MLNLPEELVLLSLDDQKGSPYGVVTQTALRYALAAAMLADLALQGRICLDDQRVILAPCEGGVAPQAGPPPGDPLLDEAFRQLSKVDKPRKVKYWINAFGYRKLPRQVAQGLVERGVLVQDEDHRFHGATPNAVHAPAETPTKYWIKDGLRAGVLANAPLHRRQVVLLSLLRGCRMLNLIFTRDERKPAAGRVDELVAGEDFGAALRQTLVDIAAVTRDAVGS